ncbi:MAG: hypothetical protein GX815_04880 [Clostridiales bacterium]|nr:hypothetical protein [Clostridiales bacterium]
MMRKKVFLISLVLILAISLASCQLAKVDGLEVQNDRLIGVFITSEYLDLFDFDRYFQDNITSIMKKGGDVAIEHSEKYQGRIYAELKPMVFEDSEPFQSEVFMEYMFEGIEGIPFLHYQVQQTDYEPYRAMSSGNHFSDAHLSIGDETSIEGTIYVTANATHHAYYLNPVYQSSDGQVYLTAGSGISFSGDMSEGAAFTQTLEEKYTTTENGEKTEVKFKATVKIAVKHPSTSVNVIQMDAESNIVLSQDYKPNAVPDEIELNKDTSYVIFESKIDSPEGEIIKREMFEPGDSYFTSYTPTENGYYRVQSVELLWRE